MGLRCLSGQSDMMREGVVRLLGQLMAGNPPLVVPQFCAMTAAYLACNHRFHEDIVTQGGRQAAAPSKEKESRVIVNLLPSSGALMLCLGGQWCTAFAVLLCFTSSYVGCL